MPEQYWPAVIAGVAAVLAGVSGQLVAGWLNAQRERARLTWEKSVHQAALESAERDRFADVKRELYGRILNDVSVVIDHADRDEASFTGEGGRPPDYQALNAALDRLSATAGEASLFSHEVEQLSRSVASEAQYWLDYMHNNSQMTRDREYELPEKVAALRAAMHRSLQLPVTGEAADPPARSGTAQIQQVRPRS